MHFLGGSSYHHIIETGKLAHDYETKVFYFVIMLYHCICLLKIFLHILF